MADRSAALGSVFWRFWGASALANVGDGIRVAAFPLLAASLTASPVGVAAVAAAQVLPWLVTGLLAGSLADRRGARPLIVAADAGRVAVLLTLVAAVALGWATIALVVVAAFLLGVGETLRDTAAQTAVPRLVRESQLEKANGRLVAGEIVGNEFVGAPVGALLFVAGAALPFAVNGASLALAVMLVVSLPLTLTRSRPAPAAPAAVLTWSLAVTAGAPVLLVAVTDRWAAAAVVVTTSASFAVLNVAALSVRQRVVPHDLLGRVVAASRTLTYGCAALGALAGGALAGTLGVEAPFAFSGVIAVVATLAWSTTSDPTAHPA